MTAHQKTSWRCNIDTCCWQKIEWCYAKNIWSFFLIDGHGCVWMPAYCIPHICFECLQHSLLKEFPKGGLIYEWSNILLAWRLFLQERVTNKRYVCACRILKDVRHWWPQHCGGVLLLNRWLKKGQKTSRRWICCLVPEHYRHKTRCIVFSWMALVSTITLI